MGSTQSPSPFLQQCISSASTTYPQKDAPLQLTLAGSPMQHRTRHVDFEDASSNRATDLLGHPNSRTQCMCLSPSPDYRAMQRHPMQLATCREGVPFCLAIGACPQGLPCPVRRPFDAPSDVTETSCEKRFKHDGTDSLATNNCPSLATLNQSLATMKICRSKKITVC